MAVEIPTCEPTSIRAGDSVEWDKSLADYPASEGWELSYYLRSKAASGSDLEILFDDEVAADGDTFEVRIPADRTATLKPGPYELTGRVTDGTTTKTLDSVHVLVAANVETAKGAPSFNRMMRDAYRQALLEAGEDGPYVSISINGRTIERDAQDARAELAHWEYLVALEVNPDARFSHAAEFVRE